MSLRVPSEQTIATFVTLGNWRWEYLQPFESTQGIPVVSQGRVARAKVAAALAAGACRGGNCPMRTLFFWCVSA